MPSSLILALALSLALHAALLLPQALQRNAPPPAALLQARLRLPVKPAAGSSEPLLKDTLAPEKAAAVAKPPTPPPAPKAGPSAPPVAKREAVAAAQRKLSQHLYYPPEAVERGIEGEVRLILTLRDDGSISDVHVGVSSGHAILDKAAERAAWAMGKVNWAQQSREVMLPVVFRLQ